MNLATMSDEFCQRIERPEKENCFQKMLKMLFPAKLQPYNITRVLSYNIVIQRYIECPKRRHVNLVDNFDANITLLPSNLYLTPCFFLNNST